MLIQIEIPDRVAEAARLSHKEIEAEMRKTLALALYGRAALSEGNAAERIADCGLRIADCGLGIGDWFQGQARTAAALFCPGQSGR